MLGGGSVGSRVGAARTTAQGGAAPQPSRCHAGEVAVVSPCASSVQLGAVQPAADPCSPPCRDWSRRISWALSWAFDSVLIKSAVRLRSC